MTIKNALHEPKKNSVLVNVSKLFENETFLKFVPSFLCLCLIGNKEDADDELGILINQIAGGKQQICMWTLYDKCILRNIS